MHYELRVKSVIIEGFSKSGISSSAFCEARQFPSGPIGRTEAVPLSSKLQFDNVFQIADPDFYTAYIEVREDHPVRGVRPIGKFLIQSSKEAKDLEIRSNEFQNISIVVDIRKINADMKPFASDCGLPLSFVAIIESSKPICLSTIHTFENNHILSSYFYGSTRAFEFLSNTSGSTHIQKVKILSALFPNVCSSLYFCASSDASSWSPADYAYFSLYSADKCSNLIFRENVEIATPKVLYELRRPNNFQIQKVAGDSISNAFSTEMFRLRLYPSFTFSGDLIKTFTKLGTLRVIQIYLSFEQQASLDLTANFIGKSGEIKDSCYFNQTSVKNSKKEEFAKYRVPSSLPFDSEIQIDFGKISPSIQYASICLTSFQQIPLTNYGRVSVTISTPEFGKLVSYSVPKDVAQFGYFIGAFKRLEGDWSFEYYGIPCKHSQFLSAAKFSSSKILERIGNASPEFDY